MTTYTVESSYLIGNHIQVETRTIEADSPEQAARIAMSRGAHYVWSVTWDGGELIQPFALEGPKHDTDSHNISPIEFFITK